MVSEYLLQHDKETKFLPSLRKKTLSGDAHANGARMAGEERRLQILRLAMRLFSQRGFRGTTTKEIAQAAGVSEAMSATVEDFGDSRLLPLLDFARKSNTVIDVPRLVDALIAGCRSFSAGAPQSDDITAMIVRYRTAE